MHVSKFCQPPAVVNCNDGSNLKKILVDTSPMESIGVQEFFEGGQMWSLGDQSPQRGQGVKPR